MTPLSAAPARRIRACARRGVGHLAAALLAARRCSPPAARCRPTSQERLARAAARSRQRARQDRAGLVAVARADRRRLLPLGAYSLDTRIQLAQRASTSLDVQYYVLENDPTGRLLLKALRDASERGVRVRLLVDDLYTTHSDSLLRGLASFPNVEVRLFNPFCCNRAAASPRATRRRSSTSAGSTTACTTSSSSPTA
jgi:putative cardiolipin synthase